jgi:hypothetical protein
MMMPAIGSVSGSHGDRLSALCDLLVPVPVFGPAVVIVNDTGVAPAPAAICVGLNAQVTVASGRFEQANVTAVVNVPPVGVAVKS